MGEGQKVYDAAEVLLLLIGLKGQYIQRSNIVDLLDMDIQKVKKAIAYLKDCGLITSAKKGLLWSGKYPVPENKTNEELFEIYSFTYGIGDWYADLSNFWKVITLIHCIQTWLGLDIKECARRHFAICLCNGEVKGFTFEKTRHFNQVLSSLDMEEVAYRYVNDNYRIMTEKKFDFETKRRRCLSMYQKAKLLLIRSNWWVKGIPHTIPKMSVEAYKKAEEYFPYGKKESLRDTLNKRNIFIYEYLVRQQCLGDYEFSPASPFYGHTLEERLEMLPKSIGQGSDLYNRGYLEQEQWKGVFNATETDFAKHQYVDRKKSQKYKEAIKFTKWEKIDRKKYH